MRNESVKFCLIVVTAEGWSHALSSIHATGNAKHVRELDDVYQRIRPGYGRNYVTHIARVDNNNCPFEQEMTVLERYSTDLRKRALRNESGLL